MDYFLWNTTGDVNDESLCFIHDAPEGMGLRAAKLALGRAAAKHVPDSPRITLRKESPGLALPGFIGNTKGMLILSSAGVQVVKEMCPDEKIELFPFELVNHKGRVHSTDYSIVNPLTAIPCLALAQSGATVDDDGEVSAVERVVLSRAALEDAPHLFRIAEMRVHYVFSRAFGKKMNAAGVTNVRGAQLALV